ncbi:malectin domain-containing carbohydrate-binding protein [Cyclobacterium sp. SYSU L10401]|uniref:malectin domain-containing carbohydrate-binding protein n=1 Tax=Cyclobacterium sp. SYSU L10401 TaxID=2678657 RepID=UPI0013D0715B|nr:malectin domain-containing carbohydrate-binding protein [Cyclobacterium sp. SYSU L10401]
MNGNLSQHSNGNSSWEGTPIQKGWEWRENLNKFDLDPFRRNKLLLFPPSFTLLVMKSALLPLIFILFACFPLLAQDIPIDPSFHYLDRNTGTGFDGSLGDLQILDDGKQLVGGSFATYNGKPASGLVRLLSDGQIDPAFQTGTGFQTTEGENHFVRSIQVQSDGKLLVGGKFTAYNGLEANRLIRLNPDGSRDLSFQIGVGFDKEVTTVVLQSDGKILVSGHFTSYQDEPVPSLIRIHPDGSRDPSFNPQSNSENLTRIFALQEDGKILVNAGNDFFRLHPDGSLDASFQLAVPFGETYTDPDYGTIDYQFDVYSILLEENGKIWLSGFMQKSLKGMVSQLRLFPDGSVDESFYSPNEEIGFADLRPYYFVKGGDGFVYTSRSPYAGTLRELQRILPDGRQDGNFVHPEEIPSDELQSLGKRLGFQTDGKLLVGGIRNDQTVMFRFNMDGSLDRSYNPFPEFNQEVHTLTLQADGKILVAGKFSRYNGRVAKGLARIHPDGTLDESFDAGTGLYHPFFEPSLSILPQEDGKILLFGNFTSYNDSPAGGIVRLLPDGKKDMEFDAGSGFDPGSNFPAALQKDGKIIVAGEDFNGEPIPGLIRLNSDGSKDTSFDIGSGFNGAIVSLAITPENKILLAGNFTSFNGHPVKLLTRLNADGSLDTSFKVNEQLDIRPEKLLVQKDGKILLAASDGPTGDESSLIRLHPDGSQDRGFKAGIAASGHMELFTIQPDGKTLLSWGKYSQPHILTRLMPDGSVDPTLKLDYDFNGEIKTMAVDSKGNLLAGGSFTSFEGINAYRIAQIPDIVNQPPALDNVFRINAGGPYLYRGSEVWLPDTRFSGGNTYSNQVPISNTENDALYQTERNGDFSYEIPVPRPGQYTLELHFAEIFWEQPGARLFDLKVENDLFRTNIDLVKDIGLKKAKVVRIEDLEVRDGHLNLEFISRKDRAKISGIALYKQAQKETSEDIWINAGGEALYYLGTEWLSDRYYLGGKTHYDNSRSISATDMDELHQSERYGKFNYHIPVPKAGKYLLVLYLSEIFWEKEGERVFDVLIENGQSELKNLDLIKLTGEPNHAYMLNAGTVEVMDGTFDLEFTPTINQAKVSGIRLAPVDPDTGAPAISQPEDQTLNEGQKWSYQLEAYSLVDGENLHYFAEGLPESLSLDPDTGHISGSVSTPGRYEIALKVTDQQGFSAYADFSITVNPLTVVRRINAGGFWLDAGDIQWQGDLRHPTGSIYSTNAAISNTELDTIYQSERNGDFSYEIKVPARGDYTVELHFAEIHWTRENARLFRYQLENEPLSEIIDLYKDHGGANHAYVRTIHDVQVTDGYLSLEMITVKDRAKLSGIVVYRQGTLASAARMATESQMGEQQEFGESNSEEEIEVVNLYPNPARDHLNLEFEAKESGVWSFELVNSLGVSTYLDRVNLETGRHRLEFDLSAYRFSAGTYYLRMESEREASRVLRVILY